MDEWRSDREPRQPARFQFPTPFLPTATPRASPSYYSRKECATTGAMTAMMTKAYNNMKTVLLLGLMTGLILFVGSFFGKGGLMIALVMAAVMNFVSYFF